MVTAHFSKNECSAGNSADLQNYGFDAGYLATERFDGFLLITIQKYRSALEEADGLAIRLNLKRLMKLGIFVDDTNRHQIVRADATRAALIKTSTLADDANASLNLFNTCPSFPSSYASRGRLSLDKVTLAEDPVDTGENESLGGTLTATLTRANEELPVGTIDVVFDFSPPRRPLIDNK
jgi:hypothetical protein